MKEMTIHGTDVSGSSVATGPAGAPPVVGAAAGATPPGPSELERALAEYDDASDEEGALTCIVCKEGLNALGSNPLGVYVYCKRV